jgi:UDP-glucose 4-epimerase
MKCIVFGGNGYIGANLVEFLKFNGCAVNKGIHNNPRFDLRDRDLISTIDWNVDCVFMMAGKTGTLVSFDKYQDFLFDNQLILLNILDSIRKSGYRPKIIFPSTRTVYKGDEKALSINSVLESKTLYAANKIACEQILHAYSFAYNIPFNILRICVPYGNNVGDEYSFGTLQFFLEQWNENGVIELFGDGHAKRTFSHINDICKSFYLLAKNTEIVNSVFNIPGETFSLLDLALLITKSPERIVFKDWPLMHQRIETGSTFFESEFLEEELKIDTSGKLKKWISEMKSTGVIPDE